MVRVRYTGNAGRYKHTKAGVSVEHGEAVDVDEETAEYLLGRDDFEPADSTTGEESTEDLEYEEVSAIEDRLDAGECPWCSEYEGDGAAQHAASAHPDEWTAYKED